MKNLVTGLMLAGMLLFGGVPAQAQEPTDSTTTTTTVDTAPIATPDVNVDVQTTTIPAEPSFDVNVQAPPVTNTSTTTNTTERTERTVLQPVTTADTNDSSTVLMLVGGGLAILIILALVAMAVNRNDTHTRTVVSDRREVVR